jgi:hypothetical protein
MFTYDEDTRCFWFSSTALENAREFNLIGKVCTIVPVMCIRASICVCMCVCLGERKRIQSHAMRSLLGLLVCACVFACVYVYMCAWENMRGFNLIGKVSTGTVVVCACLFTCVCVYMCVWENLRGFNLIGKDCCFVCMCIHMCMCIYVCLENMRGFNLIGKDCCCVLMCLRMCIFMYVCILQVTQENST